MSARGAPSGATLPSRRALRWGGWFLALALLTIALRVVQPRLDKAHVTLVYLLVVLGASAAGGRALGLTIAGVAFLSFNLFFLPPYHTLVVTNPLDWLVLAAFLITSVVATELLSRANSTAEAAIQRAEEVDRLAALGAETLSAPGAAQALQAIVDVIRDATRADLCEVFRRRADGSLLRVALASRGATLTPAPRDGGGVDADDLPALSPLAAQLPGALPGHLEHERAGIAGTSSLLRWLADRGRSAVELADGTIRLAPEEVDGSSDDATIPPDGAPAHAASPVADSPVAGQPVTRAIAGSRLASLRYVVAPAERPRASRRLARRPAAGGVRPTEWDAARARLDAPAVRALLLPLIVREHTVGMLRLVSHAGVVLTPEQARLLVALAYFAALGVERARLVESAERAEAERRLESLRSALLTAVSHDLRTPLTTIKGIAHEVACGADPARAAVIEAEADRLNELVSDLLDLSRIQAGAVRPHVAVNTADELIGAALQRADGALRGRRVDVELLPGEVLAGRFDFTQALRVLVNLLENAAKYAPPDEPIELRAHRAGDRLVVTVLDRGSGVPVSERERIFEPFYRPPGTPPDVRGTGLGLSIARGMAEAQGGAVRYEPRADGGSAFVLELPAADSIPSDGESTARASG